MTRCRGINRPRHLLRDSILEAIRQGATRIRRPRWDSSNFSTVCHLLGLEMIPYTDEWEPTPITMRQVEDYIRRRYAGDSPLAVNDIYPVQAIAADHAHLR